VFAHECGFTRVHFENDNENLMKELNGIETGYRNYTGAIIDSILDLKVYFRQCMFSFVRRSGNKVAHFLAQLATTEPDKVWMEDVPSNAHSLYFSDLIS